MRDVSWGPSHQQPTRRRWGGRLSLAVLWLIVLVATSSNETVSDLLVLITIVVLLWRLVAFLLRRFPNRRQWLRRRRRSRGDALAGVRSGGAGIYLGVDARGQMRRGRPERAVLVLGPPRSGKTSGVIIPSLLAHRGAAVSTSTKPDVMAATAATRARDGRVWEFDPTGASRDVVAGVERLRWSPVLCSSDWDGALLMARAMVTGAGVGAGTTDSSHWARRAQALLAPLLHAAAVGGREVSDVVGWVSRHEIDEPGALLQDHHGAELAAGQLTGVQNTEERERSSIFSAAADALDAYTSHAAIKAATHPNFFAARFVRSTDTIYIHAPAEHQQLAAPLVCGLLAEIRRAAYALHRQAPGGPPVLFALDEVANIAPLAELPQIASEGGSQGLMLLAALQDLSQARGRWGASADGFLTLFGTKLILPGIADQKTLEAVSTMLGEYDRQVVGRTIPSNRGAMIGMILGGSQHRMPLAQPSTTYSTQRTRMLSPGEVANIPAGRALHLDGVDWELLALTPAHTSEPWRTLTAPAAA